MRIRRKCATGQQRVSLRYRLLLAAAAAMLIALSLAGLAIASLFNNHVERRAIAEAQNQQRTLLSAIEMDDNGQPKLTQQPSDPLFTQPYGGLYWQISLGQKALLRSRSLWDYELALPSDDLAENSNHVHTLKGPDGQSLLGVERMLVLRFQGKPKYFRVTVAMDRTAINRATHAFTRELALALLVLGAFLAAASYLQVTVGLQPLVRLRKDLAHIRNTSAPRLQETVPAEVYPLVSEINGLLMEQEESLTKIRARAADLAHGLKTPLTALDGDIRLLRSKGENHIADQIETVSDLMKRHITAVLSRARIAGSRSSGINPLSLRRATEAIIAVTARTPAGAILTYDLDMEPDAIIAMDSADYSELMGNLVENAARFAKSQICIRHEASAEADFIEICDDGPGIIPQNRDKVRQRGLSLDQRGKGRGLGAGLGLSIVSEILESYGAQLALGDSATGGLSAKITLPRRIDFDGFQ
ncbi:MAG: HAMP domain-containing histidine kinase [Beijerinckiaceae bacterium]|jgi:signal transduction histidine kinase|nr:HAMP domain-containing histidine kinase [Beijerinckiaceae bacterium]